MRVAIMQPYLFPYIGYFQLLHCVDIFVLLDEVAFIKKGWINRNRLLVNKQAHLFTIPLAGSSQNELIKDLRLHPDTRARQKLLATIRQEYKLAPEFDRVFPLVKQILDSPEQDLTTLVLESLQRINAHLQLAVPIIRSSAVEKAPGLRAQDRIIALCHRLNAHEYVNPLGGNALYKAPDFRRAGIKLRLLQPTLTSYQQGAEAFIPGLSVIDVLMHNTAARAQQLVLQADLREAAA